MTEKTPGRRSRRTFSPEYKHEVARELGVGAQTLGKWVAAEHADQAGEPTGELDLDERAELKRLRRELADVKKDNEFLGKAAAFFAAKKPPQNGMN